MSNKKNLKLVRPNSNSKEEKHRLLKILHVRQRNLQDDRKLTMS